MTLDTEGRYKSGRALEMAVKELARQSSQDTNRAVDDFYVGRLLERVFSQNKPSFVLKGGRCILARTVNARYTRDTDFLYQGADLDEAVDKLIAFASINLDDHLEFRLLSKERITQNQEYRDGYRLSFEILLDGTKPKGEAAVDLVVDEVSLDDVERIKPANRLNIDGIPTFDYYVCPAIYAIADKVCATMQLYGESKSSRIRDLADLAVYLTTTEFEGSKLSVRIHREAHARRITPLSEFRVPSAWYENPHCNTHAKHAKEAKLPKMYHNVQTAEELVKTCVDPAIERQVNGSYWDPNSLRWVKRAV